MGRGKIAMSNVKTLRQIAPNFCVLLRKAELYTDADRVIFKTFLLVNFE
jgi:hypothetical protein